MPSMVLGGASNEACESGRTEFRPVKREGGVDAERGGSDPGGLREGRGGAGTLGFGRGATKGGAWLTSADTDAASAGGEGCEPGGWVLSVVGVSLMRRALHAEIDPCARVHSGSPRVEPCLARQTRRQSSRDETFRFHLHARRESVVRGDVRRRARRVR